MLRFRDEDELNINVTHWFNWFPQLFHCELRWFVISTKRKINEEKKKGFVCYNGTKTGKTGTKFLLKISLALTELRGKMKHPGNKLKKAEIKHTRTEAGVETWALTSSGPFVKEVQTEVHQKMSKVRVRASPPPSFLLPFGRVMCCGPAWAGAAGVLVLQKSSSQSHLVSLNQAKAKERWSEKVARLEIKHEHIKRRHLGKCYWSRLATE